MINAFIKFLEEDIPRIAGIIAGDNDLTGVIDQPHIGAVENMGMPVIGHSLVNKKPDAGLLRAAAWVIGKKYAGA